MTPPDLARSAAKGVAWSGIEVAGSQILRLLTLLLLARMLGPEAFGLVAMATVILSFAELMVGLGLDAVIVQKRELSNDERDSAFAITLVSSLLLAAGLFACAGLISQFYTEPRVTTIIHWLSLCVVIRGLGIVPTAIMVRSLNFEALAKRRLIAVLLSSILAFAAAWMGLGVYSLVVQAISLASLEVLLVWWLGSWRPGRLRWRGGRALLGSGSTISAAKLCDFINKQSPYLIVGAVLGAQELGFLTLARRIMETVKNTIYTLIHRVTFPVLSAAQADDVQFQRILITAMLVSSAAVLPIYVGLLVLAEPLILTMLGQQWSQGVPLVQILALVGAASTILMLNQLALMAKGRFTWRLGLSATRATIGVPMFMLAAPLGTIAVAWAILARNLSIDIVSVILCHRATGYSVRTLLGGLAPILLASVAFAAAAHPANVTDLFLSPDAPSWQFLLVGGCAGSTVYLLVLAAFWRLTGQFLLPKATLDKLRSYLRPKGDSSPQ